MANYVATARSNYFRVTDKDAFIKRMGELGVQVWEESDGTVGIYVDDYDNSGWPSWIPLGESGDGWDFDIEDEVAKFLRDGQVAVFVEAGAESLRYVIGYATAVNNKGERRTVSLDHIMSLAEELSDGNEVSHPSY